MARSHHHCNMPKYPHTHVDYRRNFGSYLWSMSLPSLNVMWRIMLCYDVRIDLFQNRWDGWLVIENRIPIFSRDSQMQQRFTASRTTSFLRGSDTHGAPFHHFQTTAIRALRLLYENTLIRSSLIAAIRCNEYCWGGSCAGCDVVRTYSQDGLPK